MKNLLLVFILCPIFVLSQTKTISGIVNDENSIPLVGVNITVQNSNIGALTDFDGNYSIAIPSDKPKVLIFSYLGYSTQEIDVSLTKDNLPNDFLNSNVFESESKNIIKISKKVGRLASLTLDTMLGKIYVENGVRTWV